MIYVNNNEKLADLLEDLLKKKPKEESTSDARDLIIELRSQNSDIFLMDKDKLNRMHRKYVAENK